MVYLLIILLITPLYTLSGKEEVEQAHVAGSFYPKTKKELNQTIDTLLGELKSDNTVKALIVPHAGYVYSGIVAGSGFRLISKNFKKVFILASNHNANTPSFKFACSSKNYFETPLGKVKVSSISENLLKSKICSNIPEAFNSHVIEVEIPFLQKILVNFEIIPIITSTLNEAELDEFSNKLITYIDDLSLIVVSSDLSHYKPYNIASSLDNTCLNSIKENTLSKIMQCEACGLGAIYILSKIAQKNSWNAKIIDYKNSGDTSGIKSSVVGYGTIAYSKEPLSQVEKETLLKLARQTISQKFKKSTIKIDLIGENLKQKRGCFVTINKHGKLRGCIGSLIAKESLFDCVRNNSINAAFNDFRFSPLKEEELKEIEIEISILSTPTSYTDKKEKIIDFLIPLKHGVILQRGMNGATYLPQVWSELANKNEFLESLCLKGGMEKMCWKDKSTTIETYEAFVFSEKQF